MNDNKQPTNKQTTLTGSSFKPNHVKSACTTLPLINPLDFIGNYKIARPRLFLKLQDSELIEDMLDLFAHRQFLNLTATAHIVISNDDEGLSSFTVTEQLLKSWNITHDKLFSDAKENTVRLFPFSFSSIFNHIPFNITASDCEEVPLYVLTNSIKLFGAAALLYTDILEAVSAELGNDLLILPSSKHEILIIPYSEEYSLQYLCQMVKHINDTIVARRDVLSNEVYLFQRCTRKVLIVSSSRKELYE